MLIKVLLYGYATGVRSSRKLAKALGNDIGFRYLAANQQPDYRTISDFRKEHIEALDNLFGRVLLLCTEAGLVTLGRVALDGRKVAGNAALERNRTKAQLQAIVTQILKEAEETDAAEDALYGKDKRGDELPEHLRTREGRLKAIRDGLERMKNQEEETRTEHEKKLQARQEIEKKTGKRIGERKPKLDEEKLLRLRVNLTDPESRIMKSRRGYVQGYNGQAMVDCESQIIVAQELRQEEVDFHLLEPMLEACEQQAGNRPVQCLADGGYWSEANAALEDERTELFIAVGGGAEIEGRRKKRTRKRSPRMGPHAVRMREKLSTEAGRTIYKQRGSTVEPVFGQQYERNLNRFLLRGLQNAAAEWSLFCTTHNLLKLWRARFVFQPC